MKLIVASTIAAMAVQAMDMDHLESQWNAVMNSGNVDDDDRKIMELFTVSAVADYGCWCRFNGKRPYKGVPRDPMDQACKVWYQNYECLEADFMCGGADTIEYNDTITQVQDPFEATTNYNTECAARNPDNCQAHACLIDANFIRDMFNYLADNSLNQTLSGYFGFDGSTCRPGSNAQTTTGNPMTTTANSGSTTAPATPAPMTCCGTYPNRFPYKDTAARDCCDAANDTFNPTLHDCCIDGSIADIGNC